ncbi:unnamed protein product [Hermetia illucens]|uniref:Uncharacterized protein n=1 Tax=Hermetia illucens TaxID=343691 RepID=A0A7R8UBZ3_HERIL|nr:unnamed protein product [Hermetia illucens]
MINVLPAILQPSPKVKAYQEILSLEMMKDLHINNTSEIQLMRTETSTHQMATYGILTIIGCCLTFPIISRVCPKFKTKPTVTTIEMKQTPKSSPPPPAPIPTIVERKQVPELPLPSPGAKETSSIPDRRPEIKNVRFNDIQFF